MKTITIQKRDIPHDDLIILSRKEYESLVRVSRRVAISDRYIAKSVREYEVGKYQGPFAAKEAVRFLRERRAKNTKS